MYPSAYWGQQPVSYPETFCASLRPCLLKRRYFNPSVYVTDAEGKAVLDKYRKPKTRAPKYTDDPSTYQGRVSTIRRRSPRRACSAILT